MKYRVTETIGLDVRYVLGPGITGSLVCVDERTADFVVGALEQCSKNQDRLDRLETTVIQLDAFIRTVVRDIVRNASNHGLALEMFGSPSSTSSG